MWLKCEKVIAQNIIIKCRTKGSFQFPLFFYSHLIWIIFVSFFRLFFWLKIKTIWWVYCQMGANHTGFLTSQKLIGLFTSCFLAPLNKTVLQILQQYLHQFSLSVFLISMFCVVFMFMCSKSMFMFSPAPGSHVWLNWNWLVDLIVSQRMEVLKNTGIQQQQRAENRHRISVSCTEI